MSKQQNFNILIVTEFFYVENVSKKTCHLKEKNLSVKKGHLEKISMTIKYEILFEGTDDIKYIKLILK